ncbi:asparagine synthase [Pokkaliibacter plantistimulans]|uniref:asparagine synthase (glutamine-hydrolyzing) n=1 Tax=Pokkaliibacter plantistimulans TaxID=1635171 RepID=A0ABX5M2X8_9GAMM|nr:asparagine synthase (glutamine-hydrolyzing) [Pokkaliibacter plantistimulans]PXF32851.1 asparagine synthase [Pokkaliibacter plantistimulans]
MCGIAGLIDFNSSSSQANIVALTEALHHRGPDDGGYFFKSIDNVQVGLGHRRLSILDLSSHGHQPMAFTHLTMIYNGEVYNFREIRRELEVEGYQFDSNSDTEVILKAFHRWGIQSVQKFNGMFAIAILDTQAQKLTLIRDRMGVKPLYWYKKDGLFMFASELKSFHCHPGFTKEINHHGLALYLQHGYIPQPHTIFSHAHKLQTGHYLEFDLSSQRYSVKKYWDVYAAYNQPKLKLSEQEAMDTTEQLLKSSCAYRMVADVPVGVFLSGGYDSSTVTALLQSDRTEKLKTFSIGFSEDKFNEAPYAKQVAKYLGTDHTEYYCTQRDALAIFPRLPDIWDEPFADSSVIPTTLVSQLARQQVTVSLSADGGDELFGGYEKYIQQSRHSHMFDSIPCKAALVKLLQKIPPNATGLDAIISNFTNKYHRALLFMSSSSQFETIQSLQQIFMDTELPYLLKANATIPPTDFDTLAQLNDILSHEDKMMAMDFKTYQPDDILTKVDRATMSVGLEGREPLLDYRLVEFVARLDSNLKIRNGEKKYLLKQITHKYLPKELMDRPKMGFSMPIAEWLHDAFNEQLEYHLNSNRLEKQGLFNSKTIMKLKNRYLAGDKRHVGKLWTLLIFQMWYEKWMRSSM